MYAENECIWNYYYEENYQPFYKYAHLYTFTQTHGIMSVLPTICHNQLSAIKKG